MSPHPRPSTSKLTSLVKGRALSVTSAVRPPPGPLMRPISNSTHSSPGIRPPAPNTPTSTSRSTATSLSHMRSKISKLLTSKINRRKTLSRCKELFKRIKRLKWHLRNQPLRSVFLLSSVSRSSVKCLPLDPHATANPIGLSGQHTAQPKSPKSQHPRPAFNPRVCFIYRAWDPTFTLHSLGDSLSQYGEPHLPLPNLLIAVRGPVHARLRAKLIERTLPDPGRSSNQDAELNERDQLDEEMEADTSNPPQPAPADKDENIFDPPGAKSCGLLPVLLLHDVLTDAVRHDVSHTELLECQQHKVSGRRAWLKTGEMGRAILKFSCGRGEGRINVVSVSQRNVSRYFR
ncbi:hypothetical protein FRC12_002025 [Ceratobasidium sp. 428]|nr:hypothetical protein FRC12_002025 [Ceratobasidium sp. 428]